MIFIFMSLDVPSWDYLRPNSGVKRVLTGFLTSFARLDSLVKLSLQSILTVF